MSDDTQIPTTLRECGLLRVNERIDMTPLAGGVSCDVWKVATGDGRTFAVKRALPKLRVAEDWFAPVERSVSEVRWLHRAAAVDSRLAPAVLCEKPDQHLFAMQFLGPDDHPVWKEELVAGRVDPAFAAAVGRDLARIHAASAADPSIARDFDTATLFDALRIDPFLRYVADHDDSVADRLHALADDLAGRRIAMVHGDVSPKNILVGPGGPVFLDAECAVHGDPAFDLAFCVTHLLLKSIWLTAHTDALLASAIAMTAAYRDGVDWESADALSHRAAALVAALLLARIDGKSPVSYLTAESQKTLVRTRARDLLAGPELSLETLITGWKSRDNADAN